MRVEKRSRTGLVKAGVVLLGASYVLSIIGAGVYGAIGGHDTFGVSNCYKASAWPGGFVPVAGPLILLGSFPSQAQLPLDGAYQPPPVDCSGAFVATAVWTTLDFLGQAAGLSLLIVGAASKTSVLVPDPAVVKVGRAHVRITPSAPGALIGASLSVIDF